jgi:hypothetical protein
LASIIIAILFDIIVEFVTILLTFIGLLLLVALVVVAVIFVI